ncbi:MAG: hypothetical protein ETSY1_31005 [Candidatus Entotheonella factor]|uniref:RNA polymerase sigma factor n=1 Tax=Entotheonella factor TaxID=1429438 RepID=W4LCB8_ENTF1|nr:MAG: hypothetical protein ETSY1_31005 [Candidatus Entotheonella factor]
MSQLPITLQSDDVTLMNQVAAKDRQAFEILYRRYYQRLYGYLFKLLQRQDIVEEVINDVMMVVWNDAARFHHRSKPSTWIFGIAYNKGRKAFARFARSDRALPSPEPSQADDPERSLSRKEMMQALAQALQTLSPDHRSVIELAFIEGLSYQEIAEIAECPVNTVKTRMFHARRRLEQHLATLDVHPDLLRHDTQEER